MARSPSRPSNPVTAHLKSQKRQAIRKNKTAVAAQRTERLSKRDPARLERQIASLRAAGEARPGGLADRDRKTLETLEREAGAVRRARDKVLGPDGRDGSGGDGKDEQRLRREAVARDVGRGGGRGTERRSGSGAAATRDGGASGSETEPDVRAIPMPRDTSPPVPRPREVVGHARPPAVAQLTYSSAPVIRDLKAAVTGQKFAPAVVRRNVARMSGRGGLVDEDEWERLERAGYAGPRDGGSAVTKDDGGVPAGDVGVVTEDGHVVARAGGAAGPREVVAESRGATGPRSVVVTEVPDEDG